MDTNYRKIHASGVDAPLKVRKGHFASNHSHTNYYLDFTTLKGRASEARGIATELVARCLYDMYVDTIIAMEGCDVIAAYLADELTRGGFLNTNAHKTIYILRPEYNSNSQIIFRDNSRFMLEDKNVLILTGAVTTGKSLNKMLEAVKYYKGNLSGVAAIFSAKDDYNDVPIRYVYGMRDLPDYEYHDYHECPMCKNKEKIDGLVNAYGISKL